MPRFHRIGGRVGGGGASLMSCDMLLGFIRHQPNGGSHRNFPGGTGTNASSPSGVGSFAGNSRRGVGDGCGFSCLNRALPPEELRPAAYELALRIAGFPPTAVKVGKKLSTTLTCLSTKV